jgi:hypothetical protein
MKPTPSLCQNMCRFLKFSFETCELRDVRNEIPEASEVPQRSGEYPFGED